MDLFVMLVLLSHPLYRLVVMGPGLHRDDMCLLDSQVKRLYSYCVRAVMFHEQRNPAPE